MGMANWFAGKMVDAFLKQSPEEKARIFDTMATKFWDAATPEETAQIAELLLPRFMEHFLTSATPEQKAEVLRAVLDPEKVASMAKGVLPGLVSEHLKGMSPDTWKAFMPQQPTQPMPPTPPSRPGGGMMPW